MILRLFRTTVASNGFMRLRVLRHVTLIQATSKFFAITCSLLKLSCSSDSPVVLCKSELQFLHVIRCGPGMLSQYRDVLCQQMLGYAALSNFCSIKSLTMMSLGFIWGLKKQARERERLPPSDLPLQAREP